MYRMLALGILAAIMLGCGQPSPVPAAPQPQVAAAPASVEVSEESGVQTQLEPRKVGNFEVKAIYTGELALGHFNFYVTGESPEAVRAWVGDEAATGAMITKANWEEDHYCAHMEMPSPVPAGAALWFEIEANDGQVHKSSMPLH